MKKIKTVLFAALAALGLSACDFAGTVANLGDSIKDFATNTLNSAKELVGLKDKEDQEQDQEQKQKNYTKVEAKAATCTEDGNIEYYTDDDGLFYTKEGETYTEVDYSDVIVPAAHDLTHHEAVEGLLAGSYEYWECGVCHKFYQDVEGAIEINEGDWVNEGYAIRFVEGERMTTKQFKALNLAELKNENKAVKFDFKLLADGETHFYLGSTTANTYNVSGDIKIVKTGDDYRTSKGIIVPCEEAGKEGFVTLIVNYNQFDGDKIADALSLDNPVIDVMFGAWDPNAKDEGHPWGQSAFATVGSIVDPKSFAFADNTGFVGNHYYPGDDINTGLSTAISKTDLIGKAFELDLKIVTEGTLHFTFFSTGWVGNMTGDIAISLNGEGEYSVNKGEIAPSTVVDGYMTYKLNFEDFAGDGLNNAGADDIQVIYRDGGLPTCECWVNFNGTRVADAYPQHENIVRQTADNVPMLHTYTVADFVNKAVQMRVCIPTESNTTMKISFFESSWGKGWACDMFIKQINGSISVQQGNNTLVYEASAKDADGWFTLTINANDLTLGNGFGTATTFSWIMVWEAPNNSAISTRDIQAVDALRPLKLPGSWELPAINPTLAKVDLEGKALEFEVHFGSTADSDIHLSLYDTVETSGFIADIVVHQINGAYSATYGAANLKAQCTDLGNGNVKVVINYSEMTQFGTMVGAASVGNVIRVWPTDCGTTEGCGVYLDSFKVADRLMMGTYFAKNEAINTGGAHITKEQLQNKAVAFDLYLVEDGDVHITLFDNTWANMSGDILVTKSGDTYTSSVGKVTPCTKVGYEGYITVTVNFIQFKGDGLDRGVDLDVIYSDAGAPTTSLYADFANMRVVDMVPQLQLGDDGDHKCIQFTRAELEGKALQFKAYIPTEDDANVKISFTEHGWTNTFIPDIFVKQEAGVLTAYQYSMTANNMIGASFSEKVDGYVTVTINFYNITPSTEGNFAGTCITWASSTSGCGVDLASFKAVNEVSDVKTFGNGDFKKFGKTLLQSKLVEEGAVSFNVKMEANQTTKVSFMESTWANVGTSIFKSDASGVVSVYYGNGSTLKGEVTPLSDGWYKVTLNENEFDGDGRVACGDAFTHFYVENGTISIDASSVAYCAPHAETGVSYATGTTVQAASWDVPQGRNFAYLKAKVVGENCCISFDFKLEGDGTIQLAVMGNDWANVSGEFSITKEGESVTASYTGSKLVARGEGWYSIYLPAPFPGDGFDRESWTDLALVYSGGGYSGTSITINWNSFHILNKTCLPQ